MSDSVRAILNELREGMKPTWLDRQIARYAPSWGQRRMESRAAMAALGGNAWSGARRDLPDMKSMKSVVLSPDDEQRWDRETLLARATELEREDALAGGAIAEHTLSIVGTGLSLHPQPMRKILGWSQDQAVDWAEGVKQRFNLYAGNPRECDLVRRRNFYQAQALAYRTVLSRGDCFALMPRKRHQGGAWALKFQLIEGDRCLNPSGTREDSKISQGVEVDEFGGVTRYWFCKRHPAGLLNVKALTKEDFFGVEAWDEQGSPNVLHLFHEHRLDLRRGYPLLAPVIRPLKQLSRLSESELAASVVSSFFAVVIKKNGVGPGPLAPKKDEDRGTKELGPALLAELNPGEEIQNVAPTRPNGAFDPFWRSLVGQLAIRINTPPEVILKKFESSYTAARAALLQWFKYVLVERDTLLAPNFCQPFFEAWLAEDVASGNTLAPGFFKDPILRAAYCNAMWVGDSAPILDPLKEVLASQELVDYGFSTFTAETMRLTGGDFEPNVDLLTHEVKRRRDAGLITDLKPEAFESLDPAQDNADPSNPNQAPAKGRRAALRALAMRES